MRPRRRLTTPLRTLVALGCTVFAAACSDGVTAPPQPAGMKIAAGDGQSAVVGGAVTTAPAVRVVDGNAAVIPGVTVEFTVVAGGGSVVGGTAVTDQAGIAAATAWTLGTTPGTNEVRASAAGLGSVTLTAQAVPGPAARVGIHRGDGLMAPAGSTTDEPPAVLVTDAFGNPVAEVTVDFSVYAGGGRVAAGSVPTDERGVAAAGSWTLGDPGTNQLTATVSGLAPVVFTATAQSQDTGGFHIEVRYLSDATARQRQAVTDAVARWERVIVGDLPDVRLTHGDACGRGGLAVDEMVDDLLLYMDLDTIDGPGKVLGQAGPCFIRSGGSSLPVAGIVVLDGADLAGMEKDGSLDDVVLHEIGHVLGIGSLWSKAGLLSGAGGSDPYFTGAMSRAAFAAAGGDGYTGLHVPVENTGGSGTRDAHWRENVLRNELMTGFISTSANPLSGITVASLADLGYAVSASAADSYSVSAASVYGYQAPEMQHGRTLEELPLPFAPIPVPSGR